MWWDAWACVTFKYIILRAIFAKSAMSQSPAMFTTNTVYDTLICIDGVYDNQGDINLNKINVLCASCKMHVDNVNKLSTYLGFHLSPGNSNTEHESNK